jgi:hypothetical protein
VLVDLAAVRDDTGIFYKLYGDAAYGTHQHIAHAFRDVGPDEPDVQAMRAHNLLMSRFRIVVEQVFAELDNEYAGITFQNAQRLGSVAVGKHFMLAGWFFNIRSLFYGNLPSAMDQNTMLMSISLEEYMNICRNDDLW